MKKSKQLPLFQDQQSPKRFFGGALLCGRRKSLRPLSSKDSIHFVLRSEWAMGPDSFLAKRNYQAIDRIINKFAKRFGVRIYQRSINGNHIHLLLRITNRRFYIAFIKAVSGQIASQVMKDQSFIDFVISRKKSGAGDGLQRAGKSMKSDKISRDIRDEAKENQAILKASSNGFWQFRPFSRLVHWGKDFKICTSYLKQNVLEAFGFIPYKPRKNHYSAWIKHVVPDLNGILTSLQ